MRLFIGVLSVMALAWACPGVGAGEEGQGAPANGTPPEAVRHGNRTASGTLEPEKVIEVCPNVFGTILRIGADPKNPERALDSGSAVEEGTVLVQIDPADYQMKVAQARGQVQKCRSALHALEAHLRQAEQEWKNVQPKVAVRVISREELDRAQASCDVARADVQVGKAELAIAESALRAAEANLAATTIKSPTKGVIIDRRVNVGQVAAPSATAPSLFLIAPDLSRLQIWAAVQEADIAQIHPGQSVAFTVKALPGQRFQGAVDQIRLNASVNNSVVTYTVVIRIDNAGGKLLPYMTAQVDFR